MQETTYGEPWWHNNVEGGVQGSGTFISSKDGARYSYAYNAKGEYWVEGSKVGNKKKVESRFGVSI